MDRRSYNSYFELRIKRRAERRRNYCAFDV
nr:MAG TPA: hypothetical protein [Caudoviricetes sp.]